MSPKSLDNKKSKNSNNNKENLNENDKKKINDNNSLKSRTKKIKKNYLKGKQLINWLYLSGVISIIFYILHDIIGTINYPGYQWKSQPISDLTAIDAPSFSISKKFSSLYGIFSSLCCTLISIQIYNHHKKEDNNNMLLKIGIYLFTLMNYISSIGYYLFPLTSSGYDGSFRSIVHVYIITLIVVLLSIISLTLIAISSYKKGEKFSSLSYLSTITLFLMVIGAIGSGVVPKIYFGILERLSAYSVVIFNGILGFYGFMTF